MDINQIRSDFPLLSKGNKKLIYFDNACQSLRPQQVIDSLTEYYKEYPACSGRSMHQLAVKVTQKCNDARERIAKFIGAKESNEIIFTRNTTEAINLVAHSFGLQKGDVVITSDKEHNSNLIPWHILKKKVGIIHKIVSTTADGLLDLGAYKKVLDDGARLVSMAHTANLDGTSIPAEELIDLAHKAGAKVMLDGAQSVPHKKIDVRRLNVDFLAFSGHKMLGPSGIGVLYGKKELLNQFSPFLVGGDTVLSSTYTSHEFLPVPEKFEAGLQDYAGIIGLGRAVEYLDDIGFETISDTEHTLNAYITEELQKINGLKIIGPADPKLRSGIISFYVEKKDHHQIALMLDETANICVRSGQHCVHSWFHERKISGSVRVSVYFYNTFEEAEIFIDNVKKVISIL